MGKLSADCFSQQFNESLPKLPESLITREFDTRTRLAQSLHTFTLTKYMLSRDPGYNLLKVLVKSLVNTLKNDLSDFMQARRACRKHVFSSAEIRHEPTRLINGPFWGGGEPLPN